MNEEQCERLVKAFEKIAEWFESNTLSDVAAAIDDISDSIDEMNDKRKYNAYVLETPDVALAQAQKSDEKYANGTDGALEGIPLGIKD